MMFPQWEGKVTRRRAPRADARTARGERRQKVVAEEPLLVDQHSRIRGVRIGPEGAVDVITDEGKLMKITPKIVFQVHDPKTRHKEPFVRNMSSLPEGSAYRSTFRRT
jgi:hypothetical protein